MPGCSVSTLSCCFYQIGEKRQTTHPLIQSSSHEGTRPHLSLTTVHIKGLVVRMGRWIRLEGRQANRACLLIRAYCWLWSISIPLIHHKYINHMFPAHKMRRSMLFIVRFNEWSPSFLLCIQWSKWRMSASRTTSLDVSVISTLFELGVVSDAFWEFVLSF